MVKSLPAMQETQVRFLDWEPTPVFLPEKSHGWRILVGYSSWGYKELDMTELLTHTQIIDLINSTL